jgi:uncharacterized protein (DUF2235 family)
MAVADSGRNIVLCSDGTGQRGGPGRRSNVWRIYLAVDPRPQDGPRQIRVHDDGVGSEDFAVLRIIGGALGVGVSRNIRELYAALITSYRCGDRIYLFGFSRGAYTVRILANLICLFGIPDGSNKTPRQILKIAQSALDAYKAANIESAADGNSKAVKSFQQAHGNVLQPRQEDRPFSVHFIGCWDTVGAIGLPFDELTKAVMPLFPLRFQNNHPPSGVQHLCQALAIDEERQTFQPVLWDETNLVDNQTLEQVWFPGVHTNVGGGYPKDQLALECLKWMVQQAEKRDLQFSQPILQRFAEEASPHGKMYDSRAGLATYYRHLPRRIDRLTVGRSTPKIHSSALDRISYRAIAYAPTAITSRDYETVGTADLKPPFPESEQQKDHRIALVEQAHDYMLLRRISYYAFIFWTLCFVFLGVWNASNMAVAPLINPPDAAGMEFLRAPLKGIYSLEYQVLDTAAGVLPGFATPIIRGYQNVPGMFLLMIALLAVTLYLSRQILSLQRSAAARAWQPHQQISTSAVASPLGISWWGSLRRSLSWCLELVTVPLIGGVRRIAGRLRRTAFASRFADFWANHVAPVIGWGVIGAAVILLCFQGTRYAWKNHHRSELGTYQFGQLREFPASMLAAQQTRTLDLEFSSSSPYFPTGVFVVQGQHYEVNVTETSEWKDASLPASPDGLSNRSDEMIVQKWLKRDRQADVFMLMAAIGPDADHRTAIGKNGQFTAAVSGPLYLFVNDVPGFYHNNQGTATVTITRVSAQP